MPKPISWKEFVRKLRKFGFDGPYSGGRHLFMLKDKMKLHIPNPHKLDISQWLLAEILRQAGISSKEWNKEKNY